MHVMSCGQFSTALKRSRMARRMVSVCASASPAQRAIHDEVEGALVAAILTHPVNVGQHLGPALVGADAVRVDRGRESELQQ